MIMQGEYFGNVENIKCETTKLLKASLDLLFVIFKLVKINTMWCIKAFKTPYHTYVFSEDKII